MIDCLFYICISWDKIRKLITHFFLFLLTGFIWNPKLLLILSEGVWGFKSVGGIGGIGDIVDDAKEPKEFVCTVGLTGLMKLRGVPTKLNWE